MANLKIPEMPRSASKVDHLFSNRFFVHMFGDRFMTKDPKRTASGFIRTSIQLTEVF